MKASMRLASLVLMVIPAAVAAVAALAAQGPQRVVAVGGAVTEIVYALGAGERLVAVDSTSVHPADARTLPQVGYMRSLSAEGVLGMRPDLILATSEAGPAAVLAQLRTAGAPLITVPSDHSIETLRTRVRTVAKALGLETRGAKLEQELVAQWQATREHVARLGGRPKVLFLLAHTGNTAMVAGSGTAAEAMIRYAGAQNAITGFEGYKPLTAEAALTAAPDVILITTEGLENMGGREGLLKRPGLSLTPAGKAGRVVDLDALYLLGFGPRLPQAVGELAAALHGG